MITVLNGFPGDTIAFQCSGHVTRKDYDDVLKPAVEAAFKDHKKIRLFYKVAKDFDGVDAGAAWEDFSVGVSHLFGWERVAVVTDVEWIAHSIKAFGFLMPGVVKTFPLAQENGAREWLAAD